MTQNWCRATGVDIIRTDGLGYIEDMVSAVTDLEETLPLFVSVSDIPCLNAGIVVKIRNEYNKSKKDACSTWVPCSILGNKRNATCIEKVGGIDAFPAGVNILRGDLISEPQEELRLLLTEPRLAHNINTRADLIFADRFFLNHGE
jgi:adenosylcobinamide-phosphate guanylyltransferase